MLVSLAVRKLIILKNVWFRIRKMTLKVLHWAILPRGLHLTTEKEAWENPWTTWVFWWLYKKMWTWRVNWVMRRIPIASFSCTLMYCLYSPVRIWTDWWVRLCLYHRQVQIASGSLRDNAENFGTCLVVEIVIYGGLLSSCDIRVIGQRLTHGTSGSLCTKARYAPLLGSPSRRSLESSAR